MGIREAGRRRAMWTPVSVAFIATGIAILGMLGAQAVRLGDMRRAKAAWSYLASLGAAADAPPARFDPGMVAGRPGPARRYFPKAIGPGRRRRGVAGVGREGEGGRGGGGGPGCMAMGGRQGRAPR